ncbi:MAG: glycine cleavage T C-terminal barrel domain-containing protein [Parvularculaceae bacterium]
MKNAARARRRLVLLSLDCDAAPPGVSIRTRAGIAGVVTSAAFSPKLKRVLCFADLDRDAPLGDLEAVIGPDGSRVPARALESFEGRRAAAFRENL